MTIRSIGAPATACNDSAGVWVCVRRAIAKKLRHNMNIACKNACILTTAETHFDATGKPVRQRLCVPRGLCMGLGGMRVTFEKVINRGTSSGLATLIQP